MVMNDLPHEYLEVQHRMRPEIAQLMHHIYDNYRNHEDVTMYENIKGVHSNIYFINHNSPEAHDKDSKSHSNELEAMYVVALCRYILQQGYSPRQIAVLTMYSGQLFTLRNLMPKAQFEGVRVAVVDNYQGEENDIILLSLVRSNEENKIGFLNIENRVCVALSRAKKGLYVIGNFDMLKASGSSLWKRLISDTKRRRLYGNGLKLYCQNHPQENGIVAKSACDFETAPNGGCLQNCDFVLRCGHVCELYCHSFDPQHKTYACKKRCEKPMCKNGHLCGKACSDPCGSCEELIDKTIPGCGHIQKVQCSKDPENINCTFLIDHSGPCGHTEKIFCSKKKRDQCSFQCDETLPCGHRCKGTCVECFRGRLHTPCQKKCITKRICGHWYAGMCNECDTCKNPCENWCGHGKCNHLCGELCEPCTKPCLWQCEHFKCSKLCSEPCDRPRCTQPCSRVLPCEHPCIGLCGEPCPSVCRICDAEVVTEIFCGTENVADAHFVLMEDCEKKCIIESMYMDVYMDGSENSGQEIKLKTCPKCQTKIRKSRRYGSIINTTLHDIEGVKKTLLENNKNVPQLEGEIRALVQKSNYENLRFSTPSIPSLPTGHALVAIKLQLVTLIRLNRLKVEWSKMQNGRDGMLKYLAEFEKIARTKRVAVTSRDIDDAECELLRLEHMLKLVLHEKRLKAGLDPLVHASTLAKWREMKTDIEHVKKYNGPTRAAVERVLQTEEPLSGLCIKDSEPDMTVQALFLPTSHWMKCPLGHLYTGNGCGGATLDARCPDCFPTLGETEYQLDEQMDDGTEAGQEQASLDDLWLTAKDTGLSAQPCIENLGRSIENLGISAHPDNAWFSAQRANWPDVFRTFVPRVP